MKLCVSFSLISIDFHWFLLIFNTFLFGFHWFPLILIDFYWFPLHFYWFLLLLQNGSCTVTTTHFTNTRTCPQHFDHDAKASFTQESGSTDGICRTYSFTGLNPCQRGCPKQLSAAFASQKNCLRHHHRHASYSWGLDFGFGPTWSCSRWSPGMDFFDPLFCELQYDVLCFANYNKLSFVVKLTMRFPLFLLITIGFHIDI